MITHSDVYSNMFVAHMVYVMVSLCRYSQYMLETLHAPLSFLNYKLDMKPTSNWQALVDMIYKLYVLFPHLQSGVFWRLQLCCRLYSGAITGKITWNCIVTVRNSPQALTRQWAGRCTHCCIKLISSFKTDVHVSFPSIYRHIVSCFFVTIF